MSTIMVDFIALITMATDSALGGALAVARLGITARGCFRALTFRAVPSITRITESVKHASITV